MEIWHILKSEIKQKGLIFKFVAEKTGIPYETLKQYLNGYRQIPEAKLRCICMTFGIDLKKFGLDDTYKFQSDDVNQKEAV